MITWLSGKNITGSCYRWCFIVLMAYAVNATGASVPSTIKPWGDELEFERIVTRLIDDGFKQRVSREAMPKLVWKNLGEHLAASDIRYAGLLANLDKGKGSRSYHREVVFRSESNPELGKKTMPFAIVAIILSPDQETVTHDHFVECGPLLVHGEITEVYGYTDQLSITGTKVAILDKKRKLQKFSPSQYFLPDQENTHRLQEGTGKHPSIILNLYVEAEGNSIKNRFPTLLGIDKKSGAEWWLQ